MTPEENRRRLAQARAKATPRPWKAGSPVVNNRTEEQISTTDLLYAAKMHQPGGGKPSGRRGQSHLVGQASKNGVKRLGRRAQKLG